MQIISRINLKAIASRMEDIKELLRLLAIGLKDGEPHVQFLFVFPFLSLSRVITLFVIGVERVMYSSDELHSLRYEWYRGFAYDHIETCTAQWSINTYELTKYPLRRRLGLVV